MNNLRGTILMIGSMAGFAIEDMFIKTLTGSLPTAQILMMLGLGGAISFAVLLRMRRGTLSPLVAPVMRSRPVLIRNFGEVTASMAFITSLALVPLSTVAAVFQATPLAITAGAALFLGERVGWRRWSAIVVGFIGVVMIIRPGMAGFDIRALLPLVAVIGIAFRDLVTRTIPPEIPSMAIAFYGFLALCFASVFLTPFGGEWAALSLLQTVQTLAAIGFGVAGYWAIVEALRIAETSVVMPFRYTRLLFSLVIGVIVFAERPDTLTLTGAGVIIATGLYTVWREARVKPA